MSTRRICVYEADPTDKDFGRIFAIDPKAATGIGLPAFTSGPATPRVGTVVGEAFLNTTSKTGMVWDGSVWQPIVPAAIIAYPDDNTLLADVPPDGSYGSSGATGNLYIRAGGAWHPVGPRVYNDLPAIQADSPTDGSVAVDGSTGLFYVRFNGAWVAAGARGGVTVASALPAAGTTGDTFFNTVDKMLYVYTGALWEPAGSSGLIGEIIMYGSYTAPSDFLHCNGGAVDATAYPKLRALIGAHTPNLEGQFIRGATGPTPLFHKNRWTTGRPRSMFATQANGTHGHTAQNNGNHRHKEGIAAHISQTWNHAESVNSGSPTGGDTVGRVRPMTDYAGSHSHTINSAGSHQHGITGGDTETAPDHVYLTYLIRAK